MLLSLQTPFTRGPKPGLFSPSSIQLVGSQQCLYNGVAVFYWFFTRKWSYIVRFLAGFTLWPWPRPGAFPQLNLTVKHHKHVSPGLCNYSWSPALHPDLLPSREASTLVKCGLVLPIHPWNRNMPIGHMTYESWTPEKFPCSVTLPSQRKLPAVIPKFSIVLLTSFPDLSSSKDLIIKVHNSSCFHTANAPIPQNRTNYAWLYFEYNNNMLTNPEAICPL